MAGTQEDFLLSGHHGKWSSALHRMQLLTGSASPEHERESKPEGSFDKSSVTLDGVHPSTVSLTIHSNSSLARNIGISSLWAVPPTMAVAGFFIIPFGRRNRFNTRFIVLALVGLGMAGVGCGGGSGSKPSQGTGATYMVHVSANTGAGSTAKTVAVVVNVTK